MARSTTPLDGSALRTALWLTRTKRRRVGLVLPDALEIAADPSNVGARLPPDF
jgi:hypothetical protein